MKFDDIIYYERKDATHDATIQCICDLLEDYGTIPKSLMDKLNSQKDISVLSKWHKLAAKSESIEEFCEKMNSR